MGIEIILILVLVVLNGLFSGTELALVSAKRGRLQQRAEAGDRRATTAIRLQENPNRLLATVQVGITLIGTLTGAFGGVSIANRLAPFLAPLPIVGPIADTVALALVVVIITYLSLVVGELAPKRLALQHAESIAIRAARPMEILSLVSRPVVAVLSWSTEALLAVLGQRDQEGPSITEEDIRVLVREGTVEGAVEPQEQQFIERVFDLGDRRVRQIMTPRHRIQALNVDMSIPAALAQALADGYSRFPIYEQDLDHIVGVVHIRDLFERVQANAPDATLRAITYPAIVVPETSRATSLLPTFRKSRQHLAMVVDETGGITGLVTLEDVLEELVGEIDDERDEVAPQHIVARDDGSWLMDGTTPIDEVKRVLDVPTLPDESRGHYDTLAGIVLDMLGHIPTVGESVQWAGWQFEVVDMDELRIDKLLVQRGGARTTSSQAPKNE